MSPNAPHKIGLKSIVYLKKVEKYLRIGRKRKNKKVKKSGNSGFKEFPRPLKMKKGGKFIEYREKESFRKNKIVKTYKEGMEAV